MVFLLVSDGIPSGLRWYSFWSQAVFLLVSDGIPSGLRRYSFWSPMVFLLVSNGIPSDLRWYSFWSQMVFLLVSDGIPSGLRWYSFWSQMVFLLVSDGIPSGLIIWYSFWFKLVCIVNACVKFHKPDLRILPNSKSISDRVPKYLFIIIISPRSLQNNYPVNNLYHREPTSVHMPISSDQHTIRHGSPSKTATPAAVIIAFAGSSVILTLIMLQIIFLHYHPTKYYATM